MEIIKNFRDLLKNVDGKERSARRAVLLAVADGIKAAQPGNLFKHKVARKGDSLRLIDRALNLNKFEEILVLGAGKASVGMYQALRPLIENKLAGGVLIVPRGEEKKVYGGKVQFIGAGHPIPDEDGEKGARRILQMARSASANSLVICLISGGGSALMPSPVEGLTLKDKAYVTNLLLKSGANIEEVNTVRKHLSGIKGGRLAEACGAATVVTLILSDVVGDPVHSIASGPTAPDPTSFKEALAVLERSGIWSSAPASVRKRLLAGAAGKVKETPKPGSGVFRRVTNLMIGSNLDACLAARESLRKLEFDVLLLTTHLEGEARHIGTVLGSLAQSADRYGLPLKRRAAVVVGGETTVTVCGHGSGGRNQELVLSASMKMASLRGVAMASVGTDGIDGPTDAAGAVVDGKTVSRSKVIGLSVEDYLSENDSYHFFERLGDLVFTGPTGTNVQDISVLAMV